MVLVVFFSLITSPTVISFQVLCTISIEILVQLSQEKASDDEFSQALI